MRTVQWTAGASLFLGIFIMTAQASAESRLRLKGEVLIESGIINNGRMQGVTPKLIVRTVEGGYLVAGKSGWPWAARVGPDGKMQWRYQNAIAGLEDGEYSGAAVQTDDSVLLSAKVMILQAGERRARVLITHLDKAGQAVSEQLISPQVGGPYGIINCQLVPTTNGAILFGHVSPIGEAGRRGETLTWIAVLSSAGHVLKESMLDRDALGRGPIVSARLDSAGDIILMRYSVFHGMDGRQAEGRQIFRLGPDLAVRAQATVQDAMIDAIPALPQSGIRLISQRGREVSVVTLDDRSLAAQKGPVGANVLITNKAHWLADGSFLLFGAKAQHNGVIAAAVAWYSADLQRVENLVIEPPEASIEITDAVSTGRPGEYAFVRGVMPASRLLGRDETRSGAVIQFMQLK